MRVQVLLAGVCHLTDGFGRVEDLAYAELLALPPQLVRGTATRRTRPPTFAALLILARHRAMLLHLDVKTEGLDEDVAHMLDEADNAAKEGDAAGFPGAADDRGQRRPRDADCRGGTFRLTAEGAAWRAVRRLRKLSVTFCGFSFY